LGGGAFVKTSGNYSVNYSERGMGMKAITILQPWATLIALGEKQFETRGWATKLRGQLAIHAGKKIDREVCQQEPFRSVLAAHGYTADNLATGAVVAVANLTECWQIIGESDVPASGTVVLNDSSGARMLGITRYSNERKFGFYSTGRFAWQLALVRKLPEPIPTKGQQRLWNWVDQS
jgi:activating signal cointegrator 1